MIAQIKLDEKEYFSYVFFLCKYDYQTKVIVFNSNENKFELIDAFKNKYTTERVLYPFDYQTDGMIEKSEIELTNIVVNECMGYDWLINNPDLIKDIELGNTISEEYLLKAKSLNDTIDVFGWHEVTNEDEANELMDISGAFHDSYIRDVKGLFGRPFDPEFETKLQVSFELYGNHFDIMMEFGNGIDLNYGFSSNLNYIYLSSIVFYENRIYWLDGNDELRAIDIKDNPYISSGSLRWKIIPKLKD